MGRFKDLTGEQFGELTVLEFSHKTDTGNMVWKCLCSCGNEKIVYSGSLVRGNTKSCGCRRNEFIGNGTRTHGMRKHPMYAQWCNMKSRCDNPKASNFQWYGGAGISYEERWKEWDNFYNDMFEGWQEGLSLERKDSYKNYSHDNCIWIIMKDQLSNRRKFKNNTSGVTGVTFDKRLGRWIANWIEEGKHRTKSYAVNKFGNEEAFKLACEYRKQMIEKLKSDGVYYGEHHGE